MRERSARAVSWSYGADIFDKSDISRNLIY